MILLSLLAALLVKETVSFSEFWREQRPLAWYLTQLQTYQHKVKAPAWLYLVGVIVGPAIVLAVLLSNLPSLLSLLLSTAVLFLCIQDGDTKAHYKHIMKSLSRQDQQSLEHHCQQVGCESPQQLPTRLLFNNYQNYAAIILLFVVLGAPGAIAYALARHVAQFCVSQQCWQQEAQRVMQVIDYIPSRIIGFGYLVVGNFARALPLWLDQVFKTEVDAMTFLSEVAMAADDTFTDDTPLLERIASHVSLAKRTVSLLIVSVAGLTIFGALG